MDFSPSEWLNLAFRWLHVVAGIAWVGQTYLFSWLDSRLTVEGELEGKPDGEGGRVWMVHSGGFYLVEKLGSKVPEALPRTLYWFRWEAALTWLSGIVLLVVVYHHGSTLVASGSKIGEGTASGIGFGALLVGWLVYDLLWSSPLAKNELFGAAICYALLVAVAYGLTHVLNGRAAYIHVGAMFGTVMAANVWMRILPAQRRLVAATKEGRAPDMALAERAKQRSKHNTYLSVPLVFIMVSNHFPTTSYGADHNWLLLAAFVLVGWGARRLMVMHDNARPASLRRKD